MNLLFYCGLSSVSFTKDNTNNPGPEYRVIIVTKLMPETGIILQVFTRRSI
jgi:hypothetical protein